MGIAEATADAQILLRQCRRAHSEHQRNRSQILPTTTHRHLKSP
jgi:hypothetical protein